MLAILDWLLKIEGFVNKCIDFLLSKEKGPEISQTINNQKKKNLFDIQIGGIRNYYRAPEQKVPLKESTVSSTNIMLQGGADDEEIEEAVNQYIQSQIETENETNKEVI